MFVFFFFKDTAPTQIYTDVHTLSLHDALPCLDMMARNDVAIDPTITIHENLLLGRNGKVSPSFADIYDHMPVGQQRGLKEAWADVSAPGQDEKYRGRSEEHTSELQSLMRSSSAVFCLKKKK